MFFMTNVLLKNIKEYIPVSYSNSALSENVQENVSTWELNRAVNQFHKQRVIVYKTGSDT